MATTRVQTGLRLEEQTLAKITAIAKMEKRSLNAQIEIAVERLILAYEVEHGAVQVPAEQ